MNESTCTDHEFESLLKTACRTAFDAEARYYDEHPVKHRFSKEFEAKMKRLVHETEHRNQSVSAYHKNKNKILALIVAAMLLATTTTVLAVEPLRNGFVELIQDLFGNYAHFSFQQKQGAEPTESSVFSVCELSYLPEGFQMVSEDDLSEVRYYSIVYQNEQEELLFYEQEVALEASFNIGTEDNKFETLTIQGLNAYYSEDQAGRSIVLFNDQYVWKVYGTITKNELIKVAEHITIK